MIQLYNSPSEDQKDLEVYLFSSDRDLGKLPVGRNLRTYVRAQFAADAERKSCEILAGDRRVLVHSLGTKERNGILAPERMRLIGVNVLKRSRALRAKRVQLIVLGRPASLFPICEGLMLASYEFKKYYKEKTETFPQILDAPGLDDTELRELQAIGEAVSFSRDLINEPLNHLTAEDLAKRVTEKGKDCGFSVEVLNKKKIESLKMGGLLAVNKGSIDPPTFSILEWKPEKPVNEKPIVLVGKGVVYDTGGLSLKPTAGSMDSMKSDMSGAAAVAGAFVALSRLNLPLHVIGLLPATDNRPGGNAYTPGDVITMFDGTTVEVLNTDAEGRMILADALSYAKKYEPELVINLATLTGAAAVAIGQKGIVGMGNADDKVFNKLVESSHKVHERMALFPFWDDYKDMLKSPIADLKNIGGREAGAITAGKFLEHFTDYPFVHLDIAGPAFLNADDQYRLRGGTGVGVRLLLEFLKQHS
jgi:leucyl aminopeptidase